MEGHRLLVIANETCPCPALHDEVLERARSRDSHVLVVAPALNSRLKHWVSDVDGAVRYAQIRVDALVEQLTHSGVNAEGAVGEANPATAIDDALVDFRADELIVATHPPDSSHWLESGLLEAARERFGGPISHFVSEYGVPGASPASRRGG